MSKISDYLLTMQEEALYLDKFRWVEKFGTTNVTIFESINGPEWSPYQADTDFDTEGDEVPL